MEGLRIEFDLVGEAALSGHPLHLDALIAYAVAEDRIRDGLTEPENRLRDLAGSLPLERIEKEGDWVWAASAVLRSKVMGHGFRGWTRTTDRDEMADDHGRVIRWTGASKPFKQVIRTQSGPLRNYMVFQPTQVITRMTAWCIGDADQIKELLTPENGLVGHIGKLRRNGHGRIAAVRVIPDRQAHTRWKLRALPWREPGYVPIESPVRPPYWDRTARRIAYCPLEIF